MTRRIVSMCVLALLTCSGLIVTVRALHGEGKEPEAPPVHKAVQWASKDGSVEVFLVDGAKYPLTVISADAVKVTYFTRRNSTEGVTQVLTPLASPIKGVQRFEVPHQFSRTTIWMRLEFAKGDVRLDEMTRTFYDGIDKTVPNAQFATPPEK